MVHFGILDHYSRRSEVQQRVICTLLGVHNGDGSVNITNCFPVPHNESDTQVRPALLFIPCSRVANLRCATQRGQHAARRRG